MELDCFNNSVRLLHKMKLTRISASDTVKTSTSDGYDLLALQCSHSPWLPHMVISAMAQAVVVSFTPVIKKLKT